jgi:aarF domain-containing kinase
MSEPTLKGKIHIPKVFPELSTSRVMVAEWIDGISVAERELLTSTYRDDDSVGHPLNTPRSISHRQGPIKRIRGERKASDRINTNSRPRVYGLGVRERDVMQPMVDLFCAQVFLSGRVHCDPHPGNILVRRLPNGKPQLVLLDHGLYVSTTPGFRHQYALFWKSLFTFDNATIASVANEWGIGNTDLFASATLLKPYEGGSGEIAEIMGGTSGSSSKSPYERHLQMRAKIGEFIVNQDRMPRELIFIGRNMRIVQGQNQNLGAPVNRLKIIANWASYSLTRGLAEAGLRQSAKERVEGWLKHLVFKLVVFGLDAAFWWTRVGQKVFGGVGFEEGLEEQMRIVAKREFGIELQGGGVFAG